METHVKVLGWLYIVTSVIGILAAGFILLVLVASGALSGDRTAFAITTTIGLIVAGFITLFSIPGIVVGIGLLRFKSWARILGIVLGLLALPGFPLHTALGVYTLIVLFSNEAEQIFSPRLAM